LKSSTDSTFTELAFPSSLGPNRDIGVQVSGDLWSGSLNYALSVFNGVNDGTSRDSDDNSGKDFAGRVFSHPFKTTSIKALKDLGFGLAGTVGNRLASVLPSYKTSGQNTFFQYSSGIVGTGALYRISPQLYYYNGPFGLQAEYVLSSQDVRSGAITKTLNNTAWQATASIVVTGEKASYKSVIPKTSPEGSRRIPGAFEIAGRYHELHVDTAVFPLFASLSTAARTAKAWAVGLNWYINRNVKYVIDFEQTRFIGGAVGGNREKENSIISRIQLGY
jgi:phosphate-selective porin OprO and OprP